MRFWYSLLCLFVTTEFIQAQSVKLPEKITLKAYRVTEPGIPLTFDGDAITVISGSPDLTAFKEEPDVPTPGLKILRVVGYVKGTYNLTVVVGKSIEGKTVLNKAVCLVEIDGGSSPVDPVTPVDPVDPPVVDPADEDAPSAIDANLLRQIKVAAGTYPKAKLKSLAVAHVTIANAVKNSKNLTTDRVKNLISVSVQSGNSDLPEALQTLLGTELNKSIPRDTGLALSATQIRVIRSKLLSFAQALQSASR